MIIMICQRAAVARRKERRAGVALGVVFFLVLLAGSIEAAGVPL